MNSTSVGIYGLPSVVLGAMIVLSLSASLTAFVLNDIFDRVKLAAVANLLSGILMLVVVTAMLTHGPLWREIVVFNLILCAILLAIPGVLFVHIRESMV